MVPSVHIDHRNDVENHPIQEFTEPLVSAVLSEQVIGQIEADLSGLDLVAVNVAVYVDGGLVEMVSGFRIVEGQAQNGPPLFGLPDHFQTGQFRMGFRQGFQGLVHLDIVVIYIEPQGKFRFLPPRRENHPAQQDTDGQQKNAPLHDSPPTRTVFRSPPA